jgi:catechol 2,3-dioxygenase-like lactoylglutathione lyase family enzyme
MRGAIDHIDLTVRDPWASRAFYDAVLGFLGYRFRKEVARGLIWERPDPAGGPPLSIAVMRATGDGAARRHDRYSPGLHHLAWRAGSRADVDALHDLLRRSGAAIGATVLDPPAEYPQYEPGYYAVFFADPDGLKLELVHVP